MPVMSEVFRTNFCRHKHEECARKKLLLFLEEKKHDISDKLAREIERIEPTICPNNMEKVNRLLSL